MDAFIAYVLHDQIAEGEGVEDVERANARNLDWSINLECLLERLR